MVYGESGYERGKRTGFSPIRWVLNIIGFIIGFVLVLFIIITPISMIWHENLLFNYYYSKITDPLINTGFGNFIKKGLSTLAVPFSEKKQAEVLESYSWKSNIDQNSKKEIGIKITSFKANNKILRTKQFAVVEAVAEGYASSQEPIEVEFSCLTEEGKEGEIANKNNILEVSRNRREYFGLKCLYSKDLFEIDENGASDSQKIKIRASYDFSTEAYIPIYIIQEDVLDYKTEEGNKGPARFEYNIFEEENINDPNIDEKKGASSSVYTNGPVKLALRSISTQPYTEEGPFGSGSYYTLDIKIDDVAEWTGNLKEMNKLDIYLPEEISISSENFEYMKKEDNFNVYSAKGSLIQDLNHVCKSKDKKILDFINEACWRTGSITTSVEFYISDAPEDLSKTFIRAKLDYIFNDEKQDTITFINTA